VKRSRNPTPARGVAIGENRGSQKNKKENLKVNISRHTADGQTPAYSSSTIEEGVPQTLGSTGLIGGLKKEPEWAVQGQSRKEGKSKG